MVFPQPKFSCDSCGDRREEAFMEIHAVEHSKDKSKKLSFRHCNDRQQCISEANSVIGEFMRGTT